MSYTPLSIDLRPVRFDQVIGHTGIKKIIQNGYEQDKLPHALLFSSAKNLPGIGKTTLARLSAKLWQCENVQNNEPCNECTQCNYINKDSHPDVIEIDAASNSGVNNIRELMKIIDYGSQLGQYTILIIDEVHRLSSSAFDALLLPLEEKQSQVKFIFATTELRKVPQTVISRTMHFELKPLSNELINDYVKEILKERNVEYEEKALELLSVHYTGSVRNALMWVDKLLAYNDNITEELVIDILGIVSKDNLFTFTDLLNNNSLGECIEFVNNLLKRNMNIENILDGIYEHFSIFLEIEKGNYKRKHITKETLKLYKDRLKEYNVNWFNLVYLFPKWFDQINQWSNYKILFEFIVIELYKEWNNDTYIDKPILRKLIKEFNGKLCYYSKKRAVIETHHGNIFDVVIDEQDAENEYYCLYPDDVRYILNHPDVKGEELLTQGVIKKIDYANN